MWWQWLLFVVSILGGILSVIMLITFTTEYWDDPEFRRNRIGILAGMIGLIGALGYTVYWLGVVVLR